MLKYENHLNSTGAEKQKYCGEGTTGNLAWVGLEVKSVSG